MNAVLDPKPWPLRRLVWGAVLLFGAQIILIFLMRDRSGLPAESQRSILFRLFPVPLSQQHVSDSVLANDPTLFLLANQSGFSGPAWLSFVSRKYTLPQWSEPSRWLSLNSDTLGKPFLSDTDFRNASFLEKDKILPEISFAEFTSEDASPTSTVRVEGDLAGRKLVSIAELPVWPQNAVLVHSIVQIGVNAAGEVTSTRLTGRTQVVQVDQKALDIARQLHFQPVESSIKTELTWGNLVFQWQTIPVAATNAIAVPAENPVKK